MADDDLDIPDVDPGPREDRRRSGRGRRILMIVLAFVLLTGVAYGGWVYYWEFWASPPTGEVPVVRADTAPIKVKPAEPGGMQVPNRDKLVYDAGSGARPEPKVERLLPPAETPLPPPAPTAAAPSTPPAPPMAVPVAEPPRPRAEGMAAPPPTRPGARSVALPPPIAAGEEKPAPAAAPAIAV
ncbi:MAG: hypothetical protein HY521_13495, partial [Proteobacteria bacterium]|nr:hypothetical protein [Pseudomonadota bacterium]